MSGHTPGPWVIDYEGTFGHIKAFVGDKTPTVCKYGTDYRGERHSALVIEHQDDANARLIAAAPDLLQALEGLMHESLGYLSDLNRHQVDATTLVGAIKIARRAIEKVQGE